jgi:branched-chain amino acid transport system substrate-binding protein
MRQIVARSGDTSVTRLGEWVVLALVLITCGCDGANDATRPIVIGAPLATQYLYGWGAERGMQLAVEEINANGGVEVGDVQRLLELEVVDTRDLEPDVPVSEAPLVLEKLILEKQPDVIMGGPVRSEAALAVMDILVRHKKVSILTTGALSPAYHRRIGTEPDKYKYLFRITSEAVTLANEAVDLFTHLRRTHRFNRTFIMVQDVAHARAIGNIVEGKLENMGWEVLGHEVYPTGTVDYSSGLLRVRDAQAQTLFVWMDHPEIANLVQQWNDLAIPVLPIAGISSAVEQPGAWEATDGAVDYWVASPANAGNVPSEATHLTMPFYRAYEARWEVEPEGYGASSSYVGVYVLADAIERAGSLDPDALALALEETDVQSVYGRIRFDPDDHQVIPSYDPAEGAVSSWFQWQEGRRVVIWPPSIATGSVVIPPWHEN